MYYLLVMITIFLLSAIAYQDYKARSVGWIFFPLLAGAGIALSCMALHSIQNALLNALPNIGFIALQILLLKLYFRVKDPKTTAFIDNKIGLGDILFLLAASFFLSPLNFILFYLLSLIFAVLLWLCRTITNSRSEQWSIPLAGIQSIFFALTICVCTLFHYSLTDDSWLLYKCTQI
jgi:hypothetical protein